MKTGKPTSAGRFFRAAAALCLAIGMCTVAHAATYHVDDSAPGGGNGLSWPQAFNNLQIALGAADLDTDDTVGILDLLILLANWG